MGTHIRVLSKSHPLDTNMTGFKWFSKDFCIFVLWAKVASALEGLRLLLDVVVWISNTFDDNFGTKNDCTKYFKENCR